MKKTIKLTVVIKIVFLIIFVIYNLAYAFETPEKWEKSIVAIGMRTFELDKLTGQIKPKVSFLGTGVLIYAIDRFILVTAEHVVFEDKPDDFDSNSHLCFWGNKHDDTPFMHCFSEFSHWPNIKWLSHPDPEIDLAASIIGLDLNEEDVSFVTMGDFKGIVEIKKGTDIYYLGFPRGYGALHGSDPMVRKGIVALKERNKKYFFIDATVASGSSGSPVFTLDEELNPSFIGIVSGFPPFWKKNQFFHTGLGIVYPANYIQELLESDEFKATR